MDQPHMYNYYHLLLYNNRCQHINQKLQLQCRLEHHHPIHKYMVKFLQMLQLQQSHHSLHNIIKHLFGFLLLLLHHFQLQHQLYLVHIEIVLPYRTCIVGKSSILNQVRLIGLVLNKFKIKSRNYCKLTNPKYTHQGIKQTETNRLYPLGYNMLKFSLKLI